MRSIEYKPKVTKHFEKLIKKKETIKNEDSKPLYKMKMFNNVGSRVVEGLNNFKTYPNKGVRKDNLDHLIEKVENELNQISENGDAASNNIY